MDNYGYYGYFIMSFTHKTKVVDDCKSSVQHQKRLNPLMQKVVKKEITKWLDVGVI